MSNQYYCTSCEQTTTHNHLHNAAHGIEGSHMAGSERFECQKCGKMTYSHDLGADRFNFALDK
jgi:hypothetical protein